jgi:hypothetical protein
MAAVTGTAPDGDLAVVAELQGMLIEILETRNAELTAQVTDLADADDLGVVASHPLVDTPAVTATVTQYDEHAVACRCGRVHAAPPPPGAGGAGTVTYGPSLQAWCVFLLVAHHVPIERCAGIVEALTATRPSDGFVHSMIARAPLRRSCRC